MLIEKILTITIYGILTVGTIKFGLEVKNLASNHVNTLKVEEVLK